MSFKIGDRVEVKPEHDIPPLFRPGGKPTAGEVREVIDAETYEAVWVPIGDADIDEHSQAVFYTADQIVAAAADNAEAEQ